ncbi:hypothetical protein BB561_006025 [Smittium simulii]|uniref:Tf2-1-like SH3-like domain-containing protein n=1 Tax=Smittium simulii TaxID=133385 RepID=A0A2T9Y6Z6_9FUNG|nr:hypothetical protein BB561_006025 [Smittium simulii]
MSRLKLSPAKLVYGREIRLPKDNITGKIPTETARTVELSNINAIRNLTEKEKTNNTYTSNLQPGDRVMVLNGVLRKGVMINKDCPRYDGPYEVTEKLTNNTYRVKLDYDTFKTYHASRLIRYFSRAEWNL